MSDTGGVWRTVGGRRIFIADGEDIRTAMAKSGKFDKEWDYKGIKEHVEKLEKAVENVKNSTQAMAIYKSIESQDKIIEQAMNDLEVGKDEGNIKALFSMRRRLRLAKRRLLEKQAI